MIKNLKFKIKNLKSLESLVFYFILLFLPSQLGKHFWPGFSYIFGIRIDYLSPTLYFTDLLIIVLFTLFLLSHKKFYQISNIKYQISNSLKYILFGLFLLIGVSISKNQLAGFYGLVKLLEFIFFGYYVSKNIKSIKHFNVIIFIFSLGVFFEGILAIGQYLSQSSLGGLMYLFGERSYNSQTLNIANASLRGELVLRPYGTFPHPNVLSAYLIISLAIIISNFKFQVSSFKRSWYFLSIVLGSIVLAITMSRAAILIWLIIVGSIIVKNIKRKESIIFLLSAVIIVLILFFSQIISRFEQINFNEQGVISRIEKAQVAISIIKENPFFGVGINNFLNNLSLYKFSFKQTFFDQFQPVHNIYLLIAVETGLTGLSIFLFFILNIYKRIMNPRFARREESRIKNRKNLISKSIIHNSKFIILTSILALGFIDHYFLTLQQGQLLFSFVFGLCYCKSIKF